ncbi:hypothetical protein E4U41_000138 [Claviceps citrina]|nr:hypothetical protein E4U41_000138 [Claviceps citrina]
MSKSPSGDYTAEPLESDLFEWHFTLRGPPNSVYSEGLYHGRIVLPPTYPLRPPSFRFTTPNGRFEANREICLSISGHHEETWQPAWGIRTAIVALRSFMETDARGQLGGLETTDEVRRRLARESRHFTCPTCARSNKDIISESEQQAAESSTSKDADVQIPSELSMGWKDEMTAKAQADESGVSPVGQVQATQDDDLNRAELPKRSASAGPVGDQHTSGASRLPPPTAEAPSASSDTSRFRLTEVEDNPDREPTSQQHPPRQPTTQQPRGDSGVPIWIDRAIAAFGIALAALVIRVLFGTRESDR